MDIYESKRQKILETLKSEEGSFPKTRSSLTKAQVEKIVAHANRFGHTEQEVMASILKDSVAFRAIVGKNPGRMGYYEDTLIEFLNGLTAVKQATKLPKSGKNAYHLENGKIRQGVKSEYIKSLDIHVEFLNGAEIWITHKFTAESGGAQDDAFRDAQLTLKEALLPSGVAGVNVAAILDGAYYQEVAKGTGLTRIESARVAAPHAVVGTYLEFEKLTSSIASTSPES